MQRCGTTHEGALSRALHATAAHVPHLQLSLCQPAVKVNKQTCCTYLTLHAHTANPEQDCDEAIESYTRTRSAYYNLAPPSTYRTASQRFMDALTATFKVTVGVLGWVVSVPGKVWSLRTWSRDDWSGWWAGIKKTVKEEAHHYWVRGAPKQLPLAWGQLCTCTLQLGCKPAAGSAAVLAMQAAARSAGTACGASWLGKFAEACNVADMPACLRVCAGRLQAAGV